MTLTIGSLFSGIGGLELGLERAGLGPVLWQVESDPYCRSILAHHWPDARRYEDVREVGAELAPVDIICGGFPCQDISTAGKGAGLGGARSGLWWEFLRIVRMVGPRVVVAENVAALAARGLDQVLGGLAESGYDATWDCIPAAAVGAPHRRDRLFVVAWLADAAGGHEQGQRGQQPSGQVGVIAREPSREALADSDGIGGEPREGREGCQRPGRPELGGSGRDVAYADCWRLARERGQERHRSALEGDARGDEPHGCNLPEWPPAPDDMHAWGAVQADAQPSFCRLADGLPAGLARDRTRKLRALGNAVVPQVAEVVGRVARQVMVADGRSYYERTT